MRDKIMRVRLTKLELATIRVAAEARNLSLSELCRRTALGVRLPPRAFDRRDAELLARLLVGLGKIGSNLNQLVRAVHSGKVSLAESAVASTLCEVDGLRQKIRELLQ